MDPENKKRISIYLDNDIVEKADKALKVCGCSSRNELVAKAIEYYISEKEIEGASQYLVTRISKSIAQANDVTLKQVTTGLHRYAIYLDMMITRRGYMILYGIVKTVSVLEMRVFHTELCRPLIHLSHEGFLTSRHRFCKRQSRIPFSPRS